MMENIYDSLEAPSFTLHFILQQICVTGHYTEYHCVPESHAQRLREAGNLMKM